MILQGCLSGFNAEEEDLMATLSRLANRPLNWNVLGLSSTSPERIAQQLHASDVAAAQGGTVVALSIIHNMPVFISFDSGVLLSGLPGWRELFALPVAERIAGLSDPEVRRRLETSAASEEAGNLRARVANWPEMTIQQSYSPQTAPYEGRMMDDIARERGQRPFDALVDIVVADDLRTGLMPPTPESDADWEAGVELWHDNRVVVGGSDAGAHLDMTCGAVYSTGLLEGAVRKRSLIGWEEAIALLTDRPARLYGLRDRGTGGAGILGRPCDLRSRIRSRQVPCGCDRTCPEGPAVCTPIRSAWRRCLSTVGRSWRTEGSRGTSPDSFSVPEGTPGP